MAKYRKKPVVVEAFQFKKGSWYTHCPELIYSPLLRSEPYIDTLEGRMFVTQGDYIIRGVKGEVYPCKPDIFEATYEPVEAGDE